MTSSIKAQKKQNVGVLTSGGVISLALLEYCSERFASVIPIYIQSGLRWEEAELFWLKKLLRGRKSGNVEPLTVLSLPLRDTYQANWSVTGVKVPSGKEQFKDIRLPGREILLLSKAAIFSALHGASTIAVGFSKSYRTNGHSDTLRTQIQTLISKSLNMPLSIIAPFEEKTREEVLFDMRNSGFDYSFSCLGPKGYQHCGECYKCHERKICFFKTGITDRTHYYKPTAAVVTSA